MAALRAGVPSLLMPHWLEGFDNTKQAAELGDGCVVGTDLSQEAADREYAKNDR